MKTKKWILLFFLVVLLMLIALLPALLSSEWGKEKALAFWNEKHTEKLQIEKLKLSWFGPQIIEGIHLHDEIERFTFDCPKLKTSSSLLNLTRGRLGNLTLDSPYFLLEKEWSIAHIKKRNGLSHAGFLPQLGWTVPSSLPIRGNIEFTGGKIEIRSPDVIPTTFDNFEGKVSSEEIVLHCTTAQGNVEGSLSFNGAIDEGTLTFKGTIENLPIVGVDQIISLMYPETRGFFLEAIGPSLQLQTEGFARGNNVTISLKATSPKFQAQIETQEDGMIQAEVHAKQFSFASMAISDILGPSISADLFFNGTSQSGSIAFTAKGANFLVPRTSLSWNGALILDAPVSCQLKNGTFTVQKFKLPSLNAIDKLELTATAYLERFLNLKNVTAHLNIATYEAISIDTESPNLKAHLLAAINNQTTLTILKPIEIEATLPLEIINPRLPLGLASKAPIDLKITIAPFFLPLGSLDAEQLKLQGSGTSGAFTLLNPISRQEATFLPMQMEIKTQGATGSFIFQNERMSVSCNFQPGTLSGSVDLINYPTQVLDLLLPSGQTLSTALGPSMNLTIKGSNSGNKTTVSITSSTQKLNIEAQLAKSDEALIFSVSGNQVQAKGSFTPASHTLILDAKIQQFPSLLIDAFARLTGREDQPFSSLFGTTLNATISANIASRSGPINATIHSPNSRASLSGMLQNGVLTLSQPIYAQLTMTPALSDYLFKETNPLSISGISAEHPLTLEIDPKDFTLPIYPLNWGKASIPHARIDLGKISCQNKGTVTIALGLLKSSDLTQNKQLNLWFAPLDFSIEKGIVSCQRNEILVANSLEICTWGEIDLLQNHVDMVLGLTAQSLRKAFGIKNLPSDYVLQIPLTGPLDDVEINTGKATAKIALLLAWQQKNLAGGIIGGPAGAVVGEFLNKLGNLPDFDSKPPPARHPFPWEKPSSYLQPEAKPKKMKLKAIKKKDKPLKQLLKVFR